MIVGCPKEIKNHEYRVGLTPESAAEYIANGHQVVIETQAGSGIGASDAAYEAVGAKVLGSAAEVFDTAEMIVKVKEPQAGERKMLKPHHLLYTYLHLAPDAPQTADLVASGATCIAYETVTDASGGLPLLKPMSQVAGRMSVQAGATALEKSHGGSGVLLGGVPGVAPGKVLIIGGGVVGENALQIALGNRANCTILDTNANTLERLDRSYGERANVLYSNKAVIAQQLAEADLVIGAVLIPGAAAPKLVTRDMLSLMKPGSVLVDVAIDQGGCFETSRATTHAEPTYEVDGIVHYCVANMPGGVARTSTYALNNATLRQGLALANHGWKAAMAADAHLAEGLNVWDGKVTNKPVADALGYDYVSVADAIAA